MCLFPDFVVISVFVIEEDASNHQNQFGSGVLIVVFLTNQDASFDYEIRFFLTIQDDQQGWHSNHEVLETGAEFLIFHG